MSNSDYIRYKTLMQKANDVNFASAVLSWDQETYMPAESAELRARQQATLAGLVHEMATSEELGKVLQKLATDTTLTADEKKNVELSWKDYEKRKKLPTEFVEELSKAISEAFNSWIIAKEKNNFTLYAPALDRLFQLKRKEAVLLGFHQHPYNAMLDAYEPGMTVEILDKVFEDVRNDLAPLVKKILSLNEVNDSFFYQSYDKDQQWKFTEELLKVLGFDFSIGRQDLSAHPFSISFGPTDSRITTRVKENDLSEIIWSTIHECGHSHYETGLLMENYGLPSGEACSLSIHESQSRLWENMVGRDVPFWNFLFPRLKTMFPEQLKEVEVMSFYKASNKVVKSLIRTNADELTYHFHVLIRYEIEKGLFDGSIKVNDLPVVWNEKYKEYLGIEVPSDSDGVLQDVHWSHGSFGYFPTYSLGSFYAAQFFAQAQKDLPFLKEELSKGNTLYLLNWLREKIHRYGRLYNSEELCKRLTGEGLNFAYFMDYAKKKYQFIYEF